MFAPLSSALYSNRFKQFRILLKYDADPLKDRFFQTVALNGKMKMINFLIKEFGIDVNNQNPLCKNTALLDPANYGREEIAKYFYLVRRTLAFEARLAGVLCKMQCHKGIHIASDFCSRLAPTLEKKNCSKIRC